MKCTLRQRWIERETIITQNCNKVLILSNREDITADYVVLELTRRNVPFFRFNTEDYPLKVQLSLNLEEASFAGAFIRREEVFHVEEFRSVWYRRPSPPSFDSLPLDSGLKAFCTKESFYALEGLWASLNCFWVSDPFKIRKAENKPYQLKLATELGFKIPSTLISSSAAEIMGFIEKNPLGVIIKPVRTGVFKEGSGEKLIFTSSLKAFDAEKYCSSVKIPSIYQEQLPKEYDIRVTLIGDRVFATEIHSQDYKDSIVDWRKGENPKITHKKHKLPQDIEQNCIRLMTKLGLEFSAIDLVMTPDHEYYFLEINPNGQWAWIEQRTGYQLTEALVDLLCQKN